MHIYSKFINFWSKYNIRLLMHKTTYHSILSLNSQLRNDGITVQLFNPGKESSTVRLNCTRTGEAGPNEWELKASVLRHRVGCQ